VTKIINLVLINLVTLRARAKHEPFVQQTGLWSVDQHKSSVDAFFS